MVAQRQRRFAEVSGTPDIRVDWECVTPEKATEYLKKNLPVDPEEQPVVLKRMSTVRMEAAQS